ncbi:hypothetical protein [Actinoplanes subglobosus]|uniref:Methyl-accepting chemotaxis protein n=1 Tax=Actinoplanes subglobosus TaxID=1547892 RepID=A0ABV8ILY8_9ACTN
MARRNGWADLPVLVKVLCTVLVAAFAAAVAVGVGIVKLGEVDDAGGGIYERNMIPSVRLAAVDGIANEVRASILRHVIAVDEHVLPPSRQLRTEQAARAGREFFDPAFDEVSDALGALGTIQAGQATTAAAARTTQQAADELTRLASELSAIVGGFRH